MIYYVNNSARRMETEQKRCRSSSSTMRQKIAKAGDEVLVAPGIYHEYVDPVNGGTEDVRPSIRVRSRSAQRSPVRKR